MAVIYTWDSTKNANEVLGIIISLTDKKKRVHPFTCTHKQLSNDEIKFSLWYNPLWGSRDSYDPPSLKGTINNTTNGCILSAEVKSISSHISNIIKLAFNLFLYVASIIVFFNDFPSFIIPSITFFLVAIIRSLYFIYKYRKYHGLKIPLEIIDIAAGVDFNQIT